MTGMSFGIVPVAAFLRAFWNYLEKKSRMIIIILTYSIRAHYILTQTVYDPLSSIFFKNSNLSGGASICRKYYRKFDFILKRHLKESGGI